MSKKVRMNIGNQSVEAEKMEFNPIDEQWSRYRLEDGTVVKLKVVASDIFKLPQVDPITGLPQLMARSSNVMSVEPPELQKRNAEDAAISRIIALQRLYDADDKLVIDARLLLADFAKERDRQESLRVLIGTFWGCVFGACLWTVIYWLCGGAL